MAVFGDHFRRLIAVRGIQHSTIRSGVPCPQPEWVSCKDGSRAFPAPSAGSGGVHTGSTEMAVEVSLIAASLADKLGS